MASVAGEGAVADNGRGFSKDRIEKYELTNETLEEFLAKPREDWATCRWINGKSLFTLYGS